MKLTFKHEEEDLFDAIGSTREEAQDLVKRINDATKPCECGSRVIEELSKFSSEELAFLLYDLNNEPKNPMDLVSELLAEIREEENDDNEE